MKPCLIFLSLIFCGLSVAGSPVSDSGKAAYVTIRTTMGDVTVLLYDDTPLHRDNFVKLCREGAYDGLLFHRVIADFIIQGGDPASRERDPEAHYGAGDGGYTVPAEILPHRFCKRGALIDARLNDEINPERASAGTQFCFVQGRVMNDEELDHEEEGINQMRRYWLYHCFAKRLKTTRPEFEADSMQTELRRRVWQQVGDTLQTLPYYKIPEQQRQYYKTYGGYPYIDGSMTVFGEIVEGFEVLDAMASVATREDARPIEDIVILSTEVWCK